MAGTGKEKVVKKAAAKSAKPAKKGPRKGTKVVLLSGGNPQIAKGDGDASVEAYLQALTGWKQDAGRRLDAIIVRAAPKLRKAVKWNSPFYGSEELGWFLSFHCMTKYIKVAFFKGTSLKPMPPVESKSDATRYLHVHEGERIDEAQLADWVKQAVELPGWIMKK